MLEGEERTAQDLSNDAADRQAAALEAFNKTDDAPADDAPAGGAAPADGAKPDMKPAEGAKPEEKTAAGDGDITKAPFFNDAAFQAYYKGAEEARQVVAGFKQLFDAGRYAIKDEATLKAVHEDAFLLYDIAAGKENAGELLDVFKENLDEKQFKGVLQELANYAAREGVEGKKEAPNPLEERLSAIEQENRDRQARAEAQAEEKRQMEMVDKLEKEIRRLCAEKGLTAGEKATPEEKKEIEAEIADFLDFVSGQLGRNPEMVRQLEKGHLGESRRIFTERYNILLARAKRYNDSKIAELQKKGEKIPQTPRREGGAPPAGKEASAGKSTAERAMEMWNK